ncbi:MAG TPA: hypothetical protein ENH85_10260 [Candidatus Scalindua sp.]|nr:hypothetical protein [Candidatus Scalindua sp.]
MSNETNIKENRPWWHNSKRLIRNPFDPIYPIPQLEYCKTCKLDVDVQIEAANADGVDVYRKRCKRCGNVIQHGIARRHMTSKNSKPLPQKAINFIKQRGRDRR